MKQPKVFAPSVSPPAPPLPTGPRYRYFSTPPSTVKVKLGELAGEIPAEVRTALFDEAKEVELPTESVLKGPVPKIRLSQLAEIVPEAFSRRDDTVLRLPIARMAINYKFVHAQELIEDKPLPPLEPLISPEGSFIPDGLTEGDFASKGAADLIDTPPESFAPPDPEIAESKPALPPPPAEAESEANRPEPTDPPAETPDSAKPQGKKLFSILPIFRRKEKAEAEPSIPAIPSVTTPPAEPRPRVEIPKPRTVLPPITARVAEVAAPPPPIFPAPPVQAEAVPSLEQETMPSEPEKSSAAPEETMLPEPPLPEFANEGLTAESKAVWVETEHLPKSPSSHDIPDQEGLQSVFMTEEYLSVERVIELSGGLPGIKSCVLSQGRAVLGSHNVSENIDLVSLSANAVEMLQAMRQSAAKMGVGAVPAVTIHSDKGPITFFHQEDLCLLVMHKDRGFVPGVREKLQQVVRELSRAHLTLPVSPAKPSLGE